MFVKYLITLLMSFLLFSCASTEITQSWVLEGGQKSYVHPMIIGVSDSQQTRQTYEKHFVTALNKKNIAATPSYTLINSQQEIDKATIVNAIKGTDIDSVLITYLVSADTELKYHESPITGSYSSESDNLLSATLISVRTRESDTEVIVLKNDFYDAKSEDIVWSVQTKTVAPPSIDEVIIDVTDLLINQLLADDLL